MKLLKRLFSARSSAVQTPPSQTAQIPSCRTCLNQEGEWCLEYDEDLSGYDDPAPFCDTEKCYRPRK